MNRTANDMFFEGDSPSKEPLFCLLTKNKDQKNTKMKFIGLMYTFISTYVIHLYSRELSILTEYNKQCNLISVRSSHLYPGLPFASHI